MARTSSSPSIPRDADSTQEYRGPIEEVFDEPVHVLLPRVVAPPVSIAPIAFDARRPSVPPPSSRRLLSSRSPDASLEFPHPVSPELFADTTAELEVEEEPAAPTPLMPLKWRFIAFTSIMVVAAILVGLAIGGRSSVVQTAEAPAATVESKPISAKTLDLPDPAAMHTSAVTPQKQADPASTTIATTIATTLAPTTGTIVSPKWAAKRRVFVDGKELGRSGELEAACGLHVVKIGVAGKPRKVTVPCGGKVNVSP